MFNMGRISVWVCGQGKDGHQALHFEPGVLSRCWSYICVNVGVMFAVLQVKRSDKKGPE